MLIQNPTRKSVPIRQASHWGPVLLIEKQPVISEMLSTALRFVGHTTICLDDGAALLRLLQAKPEVCAASFMVLDMSWPQPGVETVVESLLALWTSRGMAPPGVIILTSQPPIQQAALRAGYPALLKPFPIKAFFALCEHVSLLRAEGKR